MSRLATVLDALARVEATAAARLAECQRLEREARERLAQLQAYRQDYLQQAPPRTDGATLHNRGAFLARLQAAIEQQRQQLQSCVGQTATARLAWQQARARTEALRTLLQRRAERDRQQAERRAQRELDQFLSARHRPSR